jgi:hypothetical protein
VATEEATQRSAPATGQIRHPDHPPTGEDRDALSIEISTKAPRQGLERQLVADPLDEHNPARRESRIYVRAGRAHSGY